MSGVLPEHMDGFEAEASVIGSTFLDERAVERSGCGVADFCAGRHRALWVAITALRSRQEPIDTITVGTELERTGRLEAAGGHEYLCDMAEAAATWANVAHHGELVKQAAKARGLRRIYADAVRRLDEAWATGGLDDMHATAMATADATLQQIGAQTKRANSHTHKAAVLVAVKRAKAAYEAREAGEQGRGLPWLFPAHRHPDCERPDLSGIIPAMVPGDLLALAARTSAGKTVAGYQIAHDVARATGRVCDYFTSEVDAGGMGARSLSRHASVDSLRMRSGTITDDEIDRMLAYVRDRADQPVMIWDEPIQTIEWIASMLRIVDAQRPEAQRGGLVVLDYYQRIQSVEANRMRMDKNARLAYLTPVIKGLAQSIRRPVLLLAQLRRDIPWGQAGKESTDGSKTLGDESDVMVIIRNAQSDAPNSGAPKGYAEAFVAKNRNGETGGTVPMRFNGPGQQFEVWQGDRWTPGKGNNDRGNGGWR